MILFHLLAAEGKNHKPHPKSLDLFLSKGGKISSEGLQAKGLK